MRWSPGKMTSAEPHSAGLDKEDVVVVALHSALEVTSTNLCL